MGPYYLTAMVSLLGPVRRVTGSARKTFKERVVTSEPLAGERIRVRVPTHAVGVLEFASGAIGTMTASFDVWAAIGPPLQVFGTEGSLLLPDPNDFGGEVLAWRPSVPEWTVVEDKHPYRENWRGLGAADLARALRSGRAPRASGALAFHVLDIMHAVHDSSRTGAHVRLRSTCERPAPMRAHLAEGRLD
jgi:predicted dehydrogenase